jgi:hypothetical protein
MRSFVFRAAVIVSVLLLSGSAHGASFSIVSGTLHAQSQAQTNSSSAVLTDTPTDVSLGAGTTSSSVSSTIHSDPGQADDMIGSFSTSMTASSKNVTATLRGGGTDNINVHGIASGTGSIDLVFNLSDPAQVQLASSIFGSPAGNLNITENLKLLDSTQVTVFTFPLSAANSPTMNLAAGNYELTGSVTGNPAFGEQGGADAELILSIVPEPVQLSCIAIAGLALLWRRRSLLEII